MTNSKKPGNKTQVKKSEIAKMVWNFDPVSPWFPNLNVFMYVKRKKKDGVEGARACLYEKWRMYENIFISRVNTCWNTERGH